MRGEKYFGPLGTENNILRPLLISLTTPHFSVGSSLITILEPINVVQFRILHWESKRLTTNNLYVTHILFRNISFGLRSSIVCFPTLGIVNKCNFLLYQKMTIYVNQEV